MFIREQVEAQGKNLLSAEVMKIVQRWFHRLSWSFMLLTYTECFDVLDKLKSDKSPGNDGLTAEFYKNSGQYLGTFW